MIKLDLEEIKKRYTQQGEAGPEPRGSRVYFSYDSMVNVIYQLITEVERLRGIVADMDVERNIPSTDPNAKPQEEVVFSSKDPLVKLIKKVVSRQLYEIEKEKVRRGSLRIT